MNKLIYISCILSMLLLSSCSNGEEYINWAMKNKGEKICGIEGVSGIDIDIDNTSYNWEDKPMMIAIVDTEITETYNSALEGVVYNCSTTETNETHSVAVAGIISTNSKSEYKSVLKDAPIYSITINPEKIDIAKLIEDLNCAECKGIKVVNMSFTMNYFCEELYDYMSNSKMLFVCSSGNEHENTISYPAGFNLKNVISVVAINNWGYCSSKSNYSCNADIAAPGENVMCLSKDNSYCYLSGTSYSAPFVSACSAYLISETNCNAIDAKKIILECSNKVDSLLGYVNEGRLLSMNNVVSYIDESK